MKRKRQTNDLDRQIGFKIRKCRMLLGLSQSDIASKIGVTFQQLQKYEAGINRISASQLYYVASVLNTEINYFYTETKN